MIDQLPEHYDKEFAVYKLWTTTRKLIDAVNKQEEQIEDMWAYIKGETTPKPEGQMIGGVPQEDCEHKWERTALSDDGNTIIGYELACSKCGIEKWRKPPCTHKHPDGREAWAIMHKHVDGTNHFRCELCGQEKEG
jgi:hypothetical protein